MSFVRSSKYRHIFGNPHKEHYAGVKVTRNSADSKFCAVNPKFVAIVVQGAGGGPFLVMPIDKVSYILFISKLQKFLQNILITVSIKIRK